MAASSSASSLWTGTTISISASRRRVGRASRVRAAVLLMGPSVHHDPQAGLWLVLEFAPNRQLLLVTRRTKGVAGRANVLEQLRRPYRARHQKSTRRRPSTFLRATTRIFSTASS